MFQPHPLAVALVLLAGTVARAQVTTREPRQRTVTVTVNPAEPLPELHVAGDATTVLWFPAKILKKTLTVDESRIRVLDVGERSIFVQAVEDYRADERHEIEVFFADGRAPARAAFVLVTDPAEVDTRIDVVRPELPNEPCPVDVQRDAPRPEDFVLLGYVRERGVQTAAFDGARDDAQGLKSQQGVSYRGEGWVLFDVMVGNLPGRPPFSPRDAALTGQGGVAVQARVVTKPKGASDPGGDARLLAVVDRLPTSAGPVFNLEVRGEDGRSLVIPRVKLPKSVAEGKQ
jgi:uncharacterized protein (TIGR02268 family)